MDGNFYVRSRLPNIIKELVFRPSGLSVRDKADSNSANTKQTTYMLSQ